MRQTVHAGKEVRECKGSKSRQVAPELWQDGDDWRKFSGSQPGILLELGRLPLEGGAPGRGNILRKGLGVEVHETHLGNGDSLVWMEYMVYEGT